jgi:hypothetical protein
MEARMKILILIMVLLTIGSCTKFSSPIVIKRNCLENICEYFTKSMGDKKLISKEKQINP